MTLKSGLGVTQGHWKYHPSISAGAPPQSPLGELTALPKTAAAGLNTPTSKGRGGDMGREGGEGKAGRRRGRGRKGRKGRGGAGGEGLHRSQVCTLDPPMAVYPFQKFC